MRLKSVEFGSVNHLRDYINVKRIKQENIQTILFVLNGFVLFYWESEE